MFAQKAAISKNTSVWADGFVRCANSAERDGTTDKGWSTYNLKTGVSLTADKDEFYDSISLELGLLNIADKMYQEARNSIASTGRGVYVAAGVKK